MTTAIDNSVSDEAALADLVPADRASIRWGALVPPAAWLAFAGVTAYWPQIQDWPRTNELALIALAVAVVLAAVAMLNGHLGAIGARLRHWEPWFTLIAALAIIWEIVTAKLAWLPAPFFMPPQAILEVYLDEGDKLLECIAYSALLLAKGSFVGAVVGFLAGVALGWSPRASYWGHPILRVVGPLPATAWLPFAFFVFPTSGSASVFLIALATGIPVTVLTWSGISSVNSAYYDIARTLGASRSFLVLRVAIPAAMPHVFVGLFMGLSASFAVLVVAEMMGVKAGLGWYLQWAQGWGAYANMYAALFVLAIVCASLVALLFKVRDHLLAWQKGLLRW